MITSAACFSRSPECREEIGKLPVVENLLVILQEYDLLSKRLAAMFCRCIVSVSDKMLCLKSSFFVEIVLHLSLLIK